MEKLFIPYELAVIAKEKGFNELCFTNYINGFFQKDLINDIECNLRNNAVIDSENSVTAPLYQQLVDWFRETHNLMIEITFGTDSNFIYVIRDVKDGTSWAQIVSGENYNSYYEALNTAITEAFKLI